MRAAVLSIATAALALTSAAAFGADLAPANVSIVGWSFEHGDLQAIHITLSGKFSDTEVRKAFALPAARDYPPQAHNIMSISVQDCGRSVTCLTIQGFDHMGAGDVDCHVKPPTSGKPPQAPR